MQSEDEAEFIIAECARFSSMSIEELKQHVAEWLYELSRPNGGSVLCGHAAYQKLFALTKSCLEASAYDGRLDLDDVFSEVRRTFLRSICAKNEYGNEDVAAAINAAVEVVAQSCGDIVHYFPCFLMEDGSRETFSISPVSFTVSRLMVPQLMEAMPATEDSHEKSSHAEAKEYYESFPWVAEVKVLGCDLKTSQERAGVAVRAALDVIHLLCGQKDSSRMRVGGSPSADIRSSAIYLDRTGVIRSSWARDWRGTGVGDDWWSALDDPHYQRLLTHCEGAIRAIVDPGLKHGLSRRFLDAIAWYGDGARESSYAARTLKNISAIERLLLGRRGPQISKRIRDRFSALCFDVTKMDRDAIRERVRKLYDDRSAVAHGSVSPFDPMVRNAAEESEELAGQLILVWLERSGEAFGREISGNNLEDNYDRFVSEVDKFCAGS